MFSLCGGYSYCFWKVCLEWRCFFSLEIVLDGGFVLRGDGGLVGCCDGI